MKISTLSATSRNTGSARSSADRAPRSAFGGKRFSDTGKEMLFSEFYSLLSSGIDFNRAFDLLVQGEKDTRHKELLRRLHAGIVQGDTLWQAFSRCGHFSALDAGVLRIGEETGKLNESLQFLADYYHKKAAQRRMVSGAVSYPLIILATAVVVLIFMVLVIVPMFEQVYARMGGELPAVTQAVISFSRNFKGYAVIFAVVCFGVAVLLSAYGRTNSVRRMRSQILLRLPLVGSLLKKHYQSHFCKLMYLLYSSGVPLLQGVEMLRDIITFYPYQQSFGTICDGLNNGESFAGNVAKFPELYDRKLTILLRVGEETNRLSDMLRKQGEDLSAELEHKLKQLGSMLEPILILLVGILVAIVLISMYLPMFKLGNTFV